MRVSDFGAVTKDTRNGWDDELRGFVTGSSYSEAGPLARSHRATWSCASTFNTATWVFMRSSMQLLTGPKGLTCWTRGCTARGACRQICRPRSSFAVTRARVLLLRYLAYTSSSARTLSGRRGVSSMHALMIP